MAGKNEEQKAAAVCNNCGTAHVVYLGPDGEIRPIGTGQGPDCTCDNADLRIISNDAAILEDVDM